MVDTDGMCKLGAVRDHVIGTASRAIYIPLQGAERMDTIPVTEDDAKIIEKQVESGRFRTAEDVVSAGLHLLEELSSVTVVWLTREIPNRLAEYRRNPSSTVPMEEVFSAIEQEFRKDIEVSSGK